MGSICFTDDEGGQAPSDDLSEVSSGDEDLARLHINQDRFVIDYDDIKVGRSIGSGGSDATIFRAVWSGINVAFKVFMLRDFRSEEKFAEFEREVALLSTLSHLHVIRFFGATLKPPRVGILMEFCQNGDVHDYLSGHTEVSLRQRVDFLRQISLGMDFLHSKEIMHRDLKPQNVLLDQSVVCKLIDFGLSRTQDSMTAEKTRRVGTSHYMAPEVVTNPFYDLRVDIFSFSIMAFEIVTGNFTTPFGDTSEYSIELRIANDPTFRPIWPPNNFVTLEDPDSSADFTFTVPEGVVRALSAGWSADPDSRPSFKDLLECFQSEEHVFEDSAQVAVPTIVQQAVGDISATEVKGFDPAVDVDVGMVDFVETEGEDETGGGRVGVGVRTVVVEPDVDVEAPIHFFPERIRFERVPTTFAEFQTMRAEGDQELASQEDELPFELVSYKRACRSVAYGILALLVQVLHGADLGGECLMSNVDTDRARVGERKNMKPHLRVMPEIAFSMVSSVEGDGNERPMPSNGYAFDPEVPFVIAVMSGGGSRGGIVDPDLNSLSPTERCQRVGVCTYVATQRNHSRQRWYNCMDCSSLVGNGGCCIVCAQKCHEALGHTVVEGSNSPSRFYCDCGDGIEMVTQSGESVTCCCSGLSVADGLSDYYRDHAKTRRFIYELRVVSSGSTAARVLRVVPRRDSYALLSGFRELVAMNLEAPAFLQTPLSALTDASLDPAVYRMESQWTHGVPFFSSEEGSRKAENLVGAPKHYPHESFPPAQRSWKPLNRTAEEYVVCAFERPVEITGLRIYEIAHPGKVTGIYIKNCSWDGAGVGNWIPVYESTTLIPCSKVSRLWAPELSVGGVDAPSAVTRFVRIRVDASDANAVPELDAVELLGRSRRRINDVVNLTVVEQWAHAVHKFSSEYSYDYGPQTILGPEKIFPRYGDRSGTWAANRTQDEFIEVEFAEPVILQHMFLLETNCPGALIGMRVLQTDPRTPEAPIHSRWLTIYQGSANREIPPKSRRFDVPFSRPSDDKPIITRHIRLELDCAGFPSWPEIDAVQMVGLLPDPTAEFVEVKQTEIEGLENPIPIAGEEEEDEGEGDDLPDLPPPTEFLPETIRFDRVPNSIEEFRALRLTFEAGLASLTQEVPYELISYRRACLSVAFGILSLIVHVTHGVDVGTECRGDCTSAQARDVTTDQDSVLQKLSALPALPLCFVSSVDGAERPLASNSYTFDPEVPFEIEIQPGDARGGLDDPSVSRLSPTDLMLKLGCCSYTATKKNFTRQKWYYCLDCLGFQDQNGICGVCEERCHRSQGHRTQEARISNFYCDCGDGAEMRTSSGDEISCCCVKSTKEEAFDEFYSEKAKRFQFPYTLKVMAAGSESVCSVAVDPTRRSGGPSYGIRSGFASLCGINVKPAPFVAVPITDVVPALASQSRDPIDVGAMKLVSQWTASAPFCSSFCHTQKDEMITGPPRHYPRPVMTGRRSWKPSETTADEFIVCSFETPVELTALRVYELASPGRVVGIYAQRCSWEGVPADCWVSVFEADPEPCSETFRMWEPPLALSSEGPTLVTKTIRLQVDASDPQRPPNIDAVELIGRVLRDEDSQPGSPLEVWAHCCHGFSSEYSCQYGPNTICGVPQVYPAHGDRHNTWANKRGAEEFVELEFAEPVGLRKIQIYETNLPGSVYSIEVLQVDPRAPEKPISDSWLTIYHDPPVTNLPTTARIFEPTLLLPPVGRELVTRSVRIRTNASRFSGWPEIDAVKLVGVVPNATVDYVEVTTADLTDEARLDDAETPSDDVRPLEFDLPEGWTLGGDVTHAPCTLIGRSSEYGGSWRASNVIGKNSITADSAWWSSNEECAEPYIEVEYPDLVVASAVEIGWPTRDWGHSYPSVPLVRIEALNSLSETDERVTVFEEIVPRQAGVERTLNLTETVCTRRLKFIFAPTSRSYAIVEKLVLVGRKVNSGERYSPSMSQPPASVESESSACSGYSANRILGVETSDRNGWWSARPESTHNVVLLYDQAVTPCVLSVAFPPEDLWSTWRRSVLTQVLVADASDESNWVRVWSGALTLVGDHELELELPEQEAELLTRKVQLVYESSAGENGYGVLRKCLLRS